MGNYADLYINNPVFTSAQEVMKVIRMFATDGYESRWYPVDVLNVKREVIGVANSKEEFILIWNSNPDNQQVGRIMGAYNDFDFTAIIYANKTLEEVFGNPKYEVLDSDGQVITDNDNTIILYQ